MNMLPGPAQAAAICLSVALPLLLLCYARIAAIGGSGRRFRLGCVSVIALFAIACIALYGMKLRGVWRPVYIVTAMVSLYFNVFVLVIQSFLKVPALAALAPAVPPAPPAGPVFAVVQGIVLVFFVLVTVGAWRRFKPMAFA